ncbi:MAG: polyprenyl synthetase family protein [Candidatus Hermodarchaeota archaeon]
MDFFERLKQYQEQVENELKVLFTEKTNEAEKYKNDVQKSITVAEDFVLRGGKRIRPILVLLGYKCITHEENPEILRAGLCTELMHAYFLIHDDIMDSSLLRRGKPTVHKQWEKWAEENLESSDFSKLGENMAILSGDLLENYAIEVLTRSDLPPERIRAALLKYCEIVQRVNIGQFLDTVIGEKPITAATEDIINTIQLLKTAVYTIEGPLELGALLAGASKQQLAILSDYGQKVGIAFQIQDDILGLFGEEVETGKDVLSDLREGKKTLLILKAVEAGSPKQQKRILSALGQPDIEFSDLQEVRTIVKETGSLEFSKKRVSKLISEATMTIKNSGFDSDSIELLVAFAEFIGSRKY